MKNGYGLIEAGAQVVELWMDSFQLEVKDVAQLSGSQHFLWESIFFTFMYVHYLIHSGAYIVTRL